MFQIEKNISFIRSLCQRFNVKKLFILGSAIRKDFGFFRLLGVIFIPVELPKKAKETFIEQRVESIA